MRFLIFNIFLSLFFMLPVNADKESMKTTAIGLIYVGISNKPLPSFVVTTQTRETTVQKKWFQDHNIFKAYYHIQVSSNELEQVTLVVEKNSSPENLKNYAGTYIAACWYGNTRRDYILNPQESQIVLSSIARCNIPEEKRAALELAMRRIPKE